MRSPELRELLTRHLEDVAARLQVELEDGAEVPFELEQRGGRRSGGQPALYCYRPLSAEFIAERDHQLQALPSYREAALALADFDGLERYLLSMGLDVCPAAGGARVRGALSALVQEVFREQSDFELRDERLQRALSALEHSAQDQEGEVCLLATLHGLATVSRELELTSALRIVHAGEMTGLPALALPGLGAVGAETGAAGEQAGEHVLAVLREPGEEPRAALARGRATLRALLRALRLFGDGRITFGRIGWVRVGEGGWHPLAMGEGGRPRGMLLVAPEQEDELRAFCNLVGRRAPEEGAVAWALRRYELGCEREDALDGLSDHLMALRALLEGERRPRGADVLPRRLAALCATAEEHDALGARVEEALELERAVRAGSAGLDARGEHLAREIADHLRALLRDVICDHLQPDLASLAEELRRREKAARRVATAAAAREARDAQFPAESTEEDPLPEVSSEEARPAAVSTREHPLAAERAEEAPAPSLEEILGDPRQTDEILNVLI